MVKLNVFTVRFYIAGSFGYFTAGKFITSSPAGPADAAGMALF